MLRRILMGIGVFGALVGTGYFVVLNAQSTSAVNGDVAYTCQPNGSYKMPSNSNVTLSSADQSRVSNANAWLTDMLKTATDVTTSSSILPSSDQPASYTGPLSGTINLQGASYSVVNTASISVSSPQPLSDAYRGVVSGTVLETPQAFRWIVQAYKRTPTGTVQVPVQALADGTTGAFSIDLSGVSAGVGGEWMLGLLDANAGYAPHGQLWPTPDTYSGLNIQHLIVTDGIYFWSSQPAPANGASYWFENSNTGNKMYRLVDANSGDILAEYIRPTGVVRSYVYAPGETGHGTAMEGRGFVYDQALALFAAIASNKHAEAKLLAQGLLAFQTSGGQHDGGFVFAAPQLSPSYTDPFYRTGAHAVATDALLAFIEAYPADSDHAQFVADAQRALDFIDSTYSGSGATSGLYLGGFGNYSGMPQTFDAGATITWASVEHNMDIWHVFMRAEAVLGGYRTKASDLTLAIQAGLYNTAEQRLNQGINGGVPDTADPLDANTWGAIYLNAVGKTNLANIALGRISAFSVTEAGVSGYAPFYAAGGYPGAVPTVWYEGSFGALLSYYRTGQYGAYRTLLDSLVAGQESDGSFRYATTEDAIYEIGTSRSTAATAWFVLATTGKDTIWNRCVYDAANEPAAPPKIPVTPATSNSGNTSANKSVRVVQSQASDDVVGQEPARNEDTNDEKDASEVVPIKAVDDAVDQSGEEPVAVNGWLVAGAIGGAGVAASGIIFAVRKRRDE